jgi:ABC-type multidrug transport system fused ATPase/permease subunit
MDTLAFPIFSVISGLIRSDFYKTMDEAYVRMATSVVTIALWIEVFFIMRAGYIIVGSKTTEDEKNPDLQELTYHALIICAAVFFLKSDTGPLDFVIGLKSMMIAGLTGSDKPGGQQMQEALVLIDTAFATSNIYNTTIISHASSDSNALKSSLTTLSLTSQVSPQLTGGLMLIFTEFMVRIGMAIFPLVAYAALYKATRDIFTNWLGLMLALALLVATSSVTILLAAKVTVAFVVGFGKIVLAQNLLAIPGGPAPLISEFQQSLIQSGFGFTITAIMLQFPVNAANFAGDYLKFSGATTNNELGALYSSKRTYKKR